VQQDRTGQVAAEGSSSRTPPHRLAQPYTPGQRRRGPTHRFGGTPPASTQASRGGCQPRCTSTDERSPTPRGAGPGDEGRESGHEIEDPQSAGISPGSRHASLLFTIFRPHRPQRHLLGTTPRKCPSSSSGKSVFLFSCNEVVPLCWATGWLRRALSQSRSVDRMSRVVAVRTRVECGGVPRGSLRHDQYIRIIQYRCRHLRPRR
jgi:hypothetical protein